MPRSRRKFSPEFKDEAVKAVIMNSRPIAQIARELSINEGTLGNWVATYRREHADEEPELELGSERDSAKPSGLFVSSKWRMNS